MVVGCFFRWRRIFTAVIISTDGAEIVQINAKSSYLNEWTTILKHVPAHTHTHARTRTRTHWFSHPPTHSFPPRTLAHLPLVKSARLGSECSVGFEVAQDATDDDEVDDDVGDDDDAEEEVDEVNGEGFENAPGGKLVHGLINKVNLSCSNIVLKGSSSNQSFIQSQK